MQTICMFLDIISPVVVVNLISCHIQVICILFKETGNPLALWAVMDLAGP